MVGAEVSWQVAGCRWQVKVRYIFCQALWKYFKCLAMCRSKWHFFVRHSLMKILKVPIARALSKKQWMPTGGSANISICRIWLKCRELRALSLWLKCSNLLALSHFGWNVANYTLCRILVEMSRFTRFPRHKMSAARHLKLFCTPAEGPTSGRPLGFWEIPTTLHRTGKYQHFFYKF